MQNVKLLALAIIGTAILIGGASWFLSTQTQQANDEAQATVDEATLLGEDPHLRGATASAKFTITEFSDLQCPACAATEPALEAILRQYPKDVRLVYRHFPLVTIHQNALAAAKAAEVANSFGKFWSFHDKLFASQPQWETLSNPRDKFVEYATSLGISADEFKAALDKGVGSDRVEKDRTLADQLKLNSTPSFYLNGKKTDLTGIQATLKQELKTSSSQGEK